MENSFRGTTAFVGTQFSKVAIAFAGNNLVSR
jgi:hypothetical protein